MLQTPNRVLHLRSCAFQIKGCGLCLLLVSYRQFHSRSKPYDTHYPGPGAVEFILMLFPNFGFEFSCFPQLRLCQ